ncbi:MAG: 3-deoxy-7-phosphoheptulonate synthase [Candidatus Omnitrophota bacterium]
MSFTYVCKIAAAEEIVKKLPLSSGLKKAKLSRDRAIIDIFKGRSSKFLIIIGPCSADDEKAVLEYCRRLGKLQQEVKDKIILMPRIYTNKPRTTGQGYKGMLHQPNPKEKPDVSEGIRAIRRMHIRVLEETGLSAADEMLYPDNYAYLEDLLSYVAIGARSVENQQHRLTVSGLDIPVGMKNPTSGDLNVMLNAVQAAQSPHTFIYNRWEVRTAGNPLAHCILRGAVNQYGQNFPNYHYEHMIRLAEMYLKRSLKNPAVIVDTNHANSGKKFKEQPRIALQVMHSIRNSSLLKKTVKGLMIESYLVEGAQEVKGRVFGKSITDPCLGWEESRRLILKLAERL